MSKQLTGYEKVGRLFRLLGWVSLIAGIFSGFLLFTQEEFKSDEMIGFVLLFFAVPVLYLPLGKAIKEHRRWGRIVGNIFGVLALFGIPIGTIFGICILMVLNQSWDEQPPDQPGRLGIKKKGSDITFLKRLLGATQKTENREEITGCVKCAGRNFEHDSYYDEYNCQNCGWTSKERPKGKLKITELHTKDRAGPGSPMRK